MKFSKNERREEIIRIINEKSVGTQESLKIELENRGFNTTQATLSRDIRELNLVKIVDSKGNYKYSVPQEKEKTEIKSDIFLNTDNFLSVDYALNTVVVKCPTGMAQGVCAKLDKAGIENALGTIAGDDTIFILMRTQKDAENFVKRLKIKFHL